MKRILIIAVVAFCQSVFSQDAMTFQNCLDLALKNNLDLKSAILNEQNASYQYKASYGQILPNIYGQAENRNTWGREIDQATNTYVAEALRNVTGSVNAQFNLFSGFETINIIKANKQEVKISQANVQRVRNFITIDLAQKFITILYLQEIILANQSQIQSSEKQVELADLKFNSGVISESEVFKVKSQKATEELILLTNQNNLTDNLISLKQLMNMPMEKEIILLKPELNLDKNVLLEEDQFSLTNKAVQLHPALMMSLFEEKKSRAELGIARASRYPTLGMRLSYASNYSDRRLNPLEDQFNENLVRGIRFNLVIPIFNQFEDFAKIKAIKTEYAQSKLNTQITINQLSKEVLKAITDTKTSIKKNESSSIAYEFSKKSYDADELKFQLGKININELNTTKMTYNNSQAELIQSKYELLFNNALIKFYLGEEFSL